MDYQIEFLFGDMLLQLHEQCRMQYLPARVHYIFSKVLLPGIRGDSYWKNFGEDKDCEW
jgi:hypothetical protein